MLRRLFDDGKGRELQPWRRSTPGSFEILLDVGPKVQPSAGKERPLDVPKNPSFITRRFLCRFFHQGSGK